MRHRLPERVLHLQFGGAGFEGFGFLSFALFEKVANLFGNAVLFGFDLVRLLLFGTTLFVKTKDFGYAFFDVLYIFDFEAFDDFLGMFKLPE